MSSIKYYSDLSKPSLAEYKRFVLRDYGTPLSHYDLAMDLLFDHMIDDEGVLLDVVNYFFGRNDDQSVREAFADYNE